MPELFDWDRVETLLGSRLHLNPARTSKFPEASPTDDIAQITRKIMNYVKRSQDTSKLSHERVANMMGLTPLTFNGDPMVERIIRRGSTIADNDRIVWCQRGDDSVPIAVCVSSSAKTTGHWKISKSCPRSGDDPPPAPFQLYHQVTPSRTRQRYDYQTQ